MLRYYSKYKKEYPVFYDNFHYIIVESNPYAKEKQRLLLESIHVTDEKVSWHAYSEDGFSFDRIQGCFFCRMSLLMPCLYIG